MDMVIRQWKWYCTKTQYPPKTAALQARPHATRTNARPMRHSRMPTIPLHQVRITKKLGPDQAGAKKLAQRYGENLVCVRYRQDAPTGRRYTTVEIVVDEGPIAVDNRLPDVVHLRVAIGEIDLQRQIKQLGGEWDRQHRAWRIPKNVVMQLKLHHRVVRIYSQLWTSKMERNGKLWPVITRYG